MPFSRFSAVLLGSVLLVAAPARAEEAAAQQFQSLYGDLQTAFAARDTARIDQLVAPEFTVTDFRGETRNRAQMIERLGQMPADGANKPETKVLAATVTGDAAVVDQQLTISGSRQMGGQTHTMQIVLTARDAWAKRGGAWQLVRSDQQEIVVNRDGEEFFREKR